MGCRQTRTKPLPESMTKGIVDQICVIYLVVKITRCFECHEVHGVIAIKFSWRGAADCHNKIYKFEICLTKFINSMVSKYLPLSLIVINKCLNVSAYLIGQRTILVALNDVSVSYGLCCYCCNVGSDIKLTTFVLNYLEKTQSHDDVIKWKHFPSLTLCAENSPVSGEFPAQRSVTRSFDVFFDLRLNKRLSKQSWGWWFETLSRPLWRHCNDISAPAIISRHCGATFHSHGKKKRFIVHNRYHGCWWPGDTRSQGITRDGTDKHRRNITPGVLNLL